MTDDHLFDAGFPRPEENLLGGRVEKSPFCTEQGPGRPLIFDKTVSKSRLEYIDFTHEK
ncbi:MAG: hypothetical protein K2P26_07395 [Oscillospiraceae bacterium]|nr:hypothetical protein [Oscillospiraceae bacterium]MDE6935416.1 hypothetical protein [Oscillospiraceae bacterium]